MLTALDEDPDQAPMVIGVDEDSEAAAMGVDPIDDPIKHHANPYGFSEFLEHTTTALAFEAYVDNVLPVEGWREHVLSCAQEAEGKLLTGENCNTACPNHFGPALAIAGKAEGLLEDHADLPATHTAILRADLSGTRNAGMNHANNYPVNDR
jgi:hypothetical protein